MPKPGLLYSDDPRLKNSALRMHCSSCGKGPGQKCMLASGRETDAFHSPREHDFRELRTAEAKMADWNRRYGPSVKAGD